MHFRLGTPVGRDLCLPLAGISGSPRFLIRCSACEVKIPSRVGDIVVFLIVAVRPSKAAPVTGP